MSLSLNRDGSLEVPKECIAKKKRCAPYLGALHANNLTTAGRGMFVIISHLNDNLISTDSVQVAKRHIV